MENKEPKFSLSFMKEEVATMYQVVKELNKIFADEKLSDREKLLKISVTIEVMFGTVNYTVKKMIEGNIEELTPEDIQKFSKEYLDLYIKNNTEKK